ncbi:ATP-binding cassette domain-containing protein [Lacticaseibacillus absianus]|uniref:ATP-binding cassette domain-containing protein n=1 Tax=Lacticaseibacillus absianus TaxID=2729623 RepID=UPI0015CE9939|nr:ABC transporter ATP-binding protein [Lacticaseibacillus absianus]
MNRPSPQEHLLTWYARVLRQAQGHFLWLIPAQIASQLTITLITAGLPAWLVGQLEVHTPGARLALGIAGLSLTLALATWLRPTLRTRLLAHQSFGRLRLSWGAEKEFVTGDYQNVIDPVYRERYEAAAQFATNTDNAAASQLFTAVSDTLSAASMTLILSALLGRIIWWLPLVAILVALGAAGLLAWARRVRTRVRDQNQALYNQQWVVQSAAFAQKNAKDLRLYHMAPWYGKQLHTIKRKRYGLRQQIERTQWLATTGTHWLGAARDLLVYGALIVAIQHGRIDLSTFTLAFGLIGEVSRNTTMMLTSWHQWQLHRHDLAAFTPFLPTAPAAEPAPKSLSAAPTIRFIDVSYTYPGSSTPTLHHLDLLIPGGCKAALVGRNGAGKTTLTLLLMGLLTPQHGTITLDDQPLSTIPTATLRRLFAPVFQDGLVIADTLRQNILMHQPEAPQRLQHVLVATGLQPLVDRLPQGLDTPLTTKLDDAGMDLSGGQVQQLMLARALYRDGAILVLDEPTAALDALAERRQYEAYERESTGKTSLFISHRLASTKFCDQIYYLQDGHVTEQGNHDALLAQGGAYAALFAIQRRYYQKEVNPDAPTV